MITNKEDLEYFLECDKIALGIDSSRRRPRIIFDYIWKYEIFLRHYEYYLNTQGPLRHLLLIYYKIRFKSLGLKLSYSFEPNVFGPGLSIAHYGTIVINGNARVGSNCRIQEGVTIGTTNGSNNAPVIGDNCFIGSGAKIIGDIKLGNNIAIGANALVIKSVNESNVSLGGVPARIISQKGSGENVIKATEIYSKIR